ncbi:MAG: hypothetical protein ACYCYO_11260 [Bacilli bacterium]
MVELSSAELDQISGVNWWEVSAGIVAGAVTIGVDLALPEASPWITKVGVAATAFLIVQGALS